MYHHNLSQICLMILFLIFEKLSSCASELVFSVSGFFQNSLLFYFLFLLLSEFTFIFFLFLLNISLIFCPHLILPVFPEEKKKLKDKERTCLLCVASYFYYNKKDSYHLYFLEKKCITREQMVQLIPKIKCFIHKEFVDNFCMLFLTFWHFAPNLLSSSSDVVESFVWQYHLLKLT